MTTGQARAERTPTTEKVTVSTAGTSTHHTGTSRGGGRHGGNASAGILHHHHGIVAFGQNLATHLPHVARGYASSGERQLASRARAQHRVPRIDRQVHDHLFQLLRIRANRSEIAVVMNLELDFLAQQPLQQQADLADDIGQLEHFRPQRLLTAEGEQLAGKRRGSV